MGDAGCGRPGMLGAAFGDAVILDAPLRLPLLGIDGVGVTRLAVLGVDGAAAFDLHAGGVQGQAHGPGVRGPPHQAQSGEDGAVGQRRRDAIVEEDAANRRAGLRHGVVLLVVAPGIDGLVPPGVEDRHAEREGVAGSEAVAGTDQDHAIAHPATAVQIHVHSLAGFAVPDIGEGAAEVLVCVGQQEGGVRQPMAALAQGVGQHRARRQGQEGLGVDVLGREVIRPQSARDRVFIEAVELHRSRKQRALEPGQTRRIVVTGGRFIDVADHGAAHGHGLLAEAEGVVVQRPGGGWRGRHGETQGDQRRQYTEGDRRPAERSCRGHADLE